MHYSVIENTDIQVSRFGFGTASLHHLFSSRDRQDLLDAASSAGITHFDTAPYYGYGLAEMDLGRFISNRRAGFTVTTKVGLYPLGPSAGHAMGVWARKALGKLVPQVSLPVVNWQIGRARDSLRASLKRLRTEYVDFLLLHEPDAALLDTDEFLNWLATERASGCIRAWGVAGVASNVRPWVLSQHPLATVVQTQDSIDKRQADFVLRADRSLQFTYGYLSGKAATEQAQPPELVFQEALRRNSSGTVLVSTRRVAHLASIARAVG